MTFKKFSLIILTSTLLLTFTIFLPVGANAEATNKLTNGTAFQKKKRRVKKRSVGRYKTGPRGGCYYINGKGKKTYVSHGLCR